MVRVTAAGLRCVRVTRAVSQCLCGLGVWSAADGQGGEGQIHPPVCVCSLYLLNMYQNAHATSKVTAFLGSKDILARFHNFKGLFEG